jgi:hypothetical protein
LDLGFRFKKFHFNDFFGISIKVIKIKISDTIKLPIPESGLALSKGQNNSTMK